MATTLSIQFETSVDINRPVEEVFEYVTAVENNAEWEPRMVESPPADDDMGVGTTWQPVLEGLFGDSETSMECIEYDPPSKFRYTTSTGIMSFFSPRGIIPAMPSWEAMAPMFDYENEVLESDPLEIRLAYTIDGNRLILTVDNDLTVIDTTVIAGLPE